MWGYPMKMPAVLGIESGGHGIGSVAKSASRNAVFYWRRPRMGNFSPQIND